MDVVRTVNSHCINSSCQTHGILLPLGRLGALLKILYCACQSAGQLQRGKFKNGFWRIKGNTEKYSTRGSSPTHTFFNIIQKQVSLFELFLYFSLIFVGLLSFYNNVNIWMIFSHNFSTGMLNDETFELLRKHLN